jgi:hypothetical protein
LSSNLFLPLQLKERFDKDKLLPHLESLCRSFPAIITIDLVTKLLETYKKPKKKPTDPDSAEKTSRVGYLIQEVAHAPLPAIFLKCLPSGGDKNAVCALIFIKAGCHLLFGKIRSDQMLLM